jgi:MYXO-CTERM domain-containing protein
MALACLGSLGVAGAVLATTHHTLTVDGNLSDFATDEKIEADPLGDSIYGSNNDLSTLYVSWDAQKLYLGFEYKAEQSGVMLLVETGKSGGVASFCKPGYGGAFPANLQGPDFDLMLAFFAPADHGVAPTPYLYTLAASGSNDVSATAGVELKLSETVAALGRDGRVEAAIPWSLIYGLGAGKVPAGAKLQIALALRGKLDNDGIGDLSPDPGAGVKTGACGSPATVVDKLHQVTIDANGDGAPEAGWAPATNGPSLKPDGGVDSSPPTPDQSVPAKDQGSPSADQAAPGKDQAAPAKDQGSPTTDQAATGDAASPDRKLAGDRKLTPDAGKRPTSQDEGCACALSTSPPASGWLGLALLIALVLRRRAR